MTNLGIGFKVFSGDLLEKILVKSTDTKIKSILFGTLSTLIMQFSILVSIVTISFLSAGLISLGAGIGIIFGVNLGNTASSWLIVGLTNIKILMLAIPLLIIGVLFFFQKDSILKGLGNIFIGIGFFFLGVDYIKSGFENFKHIIDLSRFDFAGFKGVLFFRIRCFAYRSYTIKHSYNGYYCRCFTCTTNQFGKFLSSNFGY
ncbi:na+/Pi-cotransporter family protein [Campylobacter jejuni subsp. jejuni DFVF1099]|nr:na+/Pi-cotransporter family protein [Campylobacter jejuni subsp. jejuni DFVF1099]